MSHGPGSAQLDLDSLPPEAAAALQAAMAGAGVTVVRSGRAVGTLEFRPHVLEGTIIDSLGDRPGDPGPPGAPPEGVTVVATAMKLSDAARRRLSDEFGADYLVLDLHRAPPSTDVLLVPPVSPQLLGMLRSQFPRARVVVTEIEDDELGVSYSGPVGRMLGAGADAYLPPRPVGRLAADVHAYLSGGDRAMLETDRTAGPALPGPDRPSIER